MHGHFSRVRFDPFDRFSAVVALQGCVSVEADHNEHTAILQHYLRTLTVDLLGSRAFTSQQAFKIAVDGSGDHPDLTIGEGHCWVDGMLVENPTPTSFYKQPDARFDVATLKLPEAFPYFVYLEVWEQLVTSYEQSEIRDVALGPGGAESSARTKVAWQVRFSDQVKPAPAANSTPTALRELWDDTVAPTLVEGADQGKLTASLVPGKDDELCALFPGGGYRGQENQLYRVEIHTGGVVGPAGPGITAPTFKWSRDNGSVVFPMRRKGQEVFVTTLGRDDRYALELGDWVELVDDASVLNRTPAVLRRVAQIDPVALKVTLDATPSEPIGTDPELHPLLRRWDQEPTKNQLADKGDNAIRIAGPGPVSFPLEDGVVVEFANGTYRAGDYWTFWARVDSDELDWPRKRSMPGPRAPEGVKRSHVPLAFVKGPKPGTVAADLRQIHAPLEGKDAV
jgi:hypothetical protein